jgi:tetratricopeptide (TPR) repeat protein
VSIRRFALLCVLLGPLFIPAIAIADDDSTATAEPTASAGVEQAAETEQAADAQQPADSDEAVEAEQATDTHEGAETEPAAKTDSATTAPSDTGATPAKTNESSPDKNAGLTDLDQATQLKVSSEGRLSDLNEVIDRLDSAIDKGLDEDNMRFANELLISSLLERATALSGAIFNGALKDPRVDPRWIQLRQFALTDLQRALELDKNLWEAHLLVGRLQALPLGDPNAARRSLTKVINAKDATAEQRALALTLRAGLPGNADREADLTRAIELEPDKPDYYRVRAQFYYGADRFSDALADVDKALELEPDHAATQELRGLVLLGLDRLDEALATFNKAGELAPDAVMPYQHRGEVYRRLGDLKKAAEQLTKALELAPNDSGTLLLRASVYYQLDDPDKALADIETVIQHQPELLVAHLLRAEIYAATDRVDQAIEKLEEMRPLAPDQPKLLEPLATYYLIAGQPHKSIEIFSKLLEADPDNYRALRFRGDSYLNIGDHRQAVADFNRALELNDDDEGLLNNFAWVLATSPMDDVRDGPRAVELATKAAEKTSYSVPHILSTLAAAYAETGDFETAKKYSQKSIEVSQSAIEMEKDPEARKKLEADHKSLQKELSSYEAGKPIRERQTQEDATPAPAPAKKPAEGTQTFAPPTTEPAVEQPLDF